MAAGWSETPDISKFDGSYQGHVRENAYLGLQNRMICDHLKKMIMKVQRDADNKNDIEYRRSY